MVPLDYTINLVLKWIYETYTKISRDEIKELLSCTKSIHYTVKNNVYQQKDGVPMGSSLAPMLARIFIEESERDPIPKNNQIHKTLNKMC